VSGLLFRELGPLLPAGLACAVGTVLGAWSAGARDVDRLVLGSLAGLAGYALAIGLLPGMKDERALLQMAVEQQRANLRRAVRSLRGLARRAGPLRSAWYLGIVLRRRLAYRSAATSTQLDRLFGAAPDPWRYDSPAERDRHAIAERFASRIAESGGLRSVLEIGCAEGAFTERLAPHCESLRCLDVSPTALARAMTRRAWPASVTFDRFDLLRDPLPGPHATIVIMDVLTYFESVAHLRAIREKLVDALEPGGWLLVGDVRQSEVYETSWWGRRLLCGGLRICEFMAAHRDLTFVAGENTQTHVFRLLRKES
jgi:SAM-dependent methyltransferase